jgi:heparan-alpha-glucosaminide N-acetyltransferase
MGTPEPATPARLVSLDAYRGFIMLVMASALGVGFKEVLKNSGLSETEHNVWKTLYGQFDHVEWDSCSFWDLIQPSFMFMVGVAIPYSHASRRAKGASTLRIAGHVLVRSLILILLGIFLSSNGSKQTDFTFVNVLTQIGLGYSFVYLLLGRGLKLQLAALLAILVGYWLFFFLHPLPAPDFDWEAVGIKSGWDHLTGLFAHWDKNANAAAAFDQWFLNLFPRPEPFKYSAGGYQTLNFIPSMATMLFGLMAGELLRSERRPMQKFNSLLLAGLVCLIVGFLAGKTVCPLVKRIWTPSWAVYSSGWTFLMLAGFYGIIDGLGWQRWSFPLVVVGMNSIAMYCMSQLMKPWVGRTVATHLGEPYHRTMTEMGEPWHTIFGDRIFSGTYGTVWQCVAIVSVLWLFCFWLYRQRFFVRI